MSFIGNLLWLIFGGGILLGLAWLLVGCIWCITVVGIPIGIACFRIAGFAFFPFGKELVPAEMVGEKRITGTGIMNFLWCLFSGLWLAIAHVLIGIADCLTIIGIPFGLANFKIANAAFAPLGKRAVSKAVADEARSRDAKATLDAKVSSAVIVIVLLSLATGCVSVSTSGAFRTEKKPSLTLSDKNFVLKDVSRTRMIEFDTQGGGRGTSTKNYDNWPEFRASLQKLESSLPNSGPEIPFNVVIRERYSVNTGAHAWTIAPWILTLGLFPAINTDENTCSIQIELPESARIDLSGTIVRDEWGCWFTLPWTFLPDDEEKSTADILAKAVKEGLTTERYEEAILAARAKREKAEAERKAREEEARIAREKAEAERKAREEEARIAREKAEAERKAKEEAEARKWIARKDNVDYKFPLHNGFPDSTTVYKDIKTGVATDWCREYAAHAKFSNVTISASQHEDYFNPTSFAFTDGTRKISLDFGAVDSEKPPVLITGRIVFEKGDVSVEALVEKYKKDLSGAEFASAEEEFSDGGGVLFGIPIPRITWQKSVFSFSLGTATVVVETTKSVAVVMGAHSVDENGNYKGPAGEIMAETLQQGYSFRGGQLDIELAGKALEIWKAENDKCGVPTVEVTDVALRDATVKAFEKEIRKQREEDNRKKEEADRKRREEEAQRANSF